MRKVLEELWKERATILVSGVIIGLMLFGWRRLPDTPFNLLETAYALTCLLFIGSIVSLCLRRVEEGYVAMIIDTFKGRLKEKYLTEGLQRIKPWQRLDLTSVKVQVLPFNIKNIQTAIGAALERIEGIVVWRPDLENLFRYFEIGPDAAQQQITVTCADFLAGVVGTMDVDDCIRRHSIIATSLESELKDPPELSLQKHLEFATRNLKEISERLGELKKEVKRADISPGETKEINEAIAELAKEELKIRRYREDKEERLKDFIRGHLAIDVSKLKELAEQKETIMIQRRIAKNFILFGKELAKLLGEKWEEEEEAKSEIKRDVDETKKGEMQGTKKEKPFISEIRDLISTRKKDPLWGQITEVAPDRSDLEREYALQIIGIELFPIKLDDATAKERAKRTWNLFRRIAAQVDWKTTAEIVRNLKDKFPDISDERALEFIYVNKGVIERKITTTEDKKVIDVPALIEKTPEIIRAIRGQGGEE